ncbi:MAG: FAD-dependent oxidoreductase [Verrucomicrobiota bacterium]
MRIIIIGAGPCGLGAAHRLHELGHTDFALYERTDQVGGLAASYIDEKGFTWDFAVHVAHSHYHYIDDLMDRLLPDGYYHHERRSWVREYDAWVPYPFQYNFRHLPEEARNECLNGLLELQQKTGSQEPPANFMEWITGTFGDGIAKHFMVPYNEKIWRVHPSEMNRHWLGDRVPVVDVDRVKKNLEAGVDDVSWGPNATFQFPKKGGTGAIWNALADTLPEENLHLMKEVISIDPHEKKVYFLDGSEDHYDHLISTVPIPFLLETCQLHDLIQVARGLKHTHVYVVGVAPNVPIPEELSEKTWVYCPEQEAIFYRVTPFSIFSPDHVPDPEQHCSFLCEISQPGSEPMLDPDALVEPTLIGLNAIGLIDCDPETTHIQTMSAEYGYPVPTVDRDEILNQIIPALEQLDITSRGRFGGWKYEVANMDHSVMQGVEAVNRILHGEEEVTWASPNIVNAGKR